MHEAKIFKKNENILFVTNSELGLYVLDIKDLP